MAPQGKAAGTDGARDADGSDGRGGAPARIVIVHPDARAGERWVSEIRALLPDAELRVWPEPCADADYAIGWRPPDDFFAAVPKLRAFFSAGAGVDHLLRNPGLPPALTLVRLEDAGMGVQMAEYCCHEVIRHYRRFADYETQQRRGEWRGLRLPPRREFEVGVFGLGVLGTQVARALAAFGYPVLGHSRSPRQIEGIECFAGEAQLPAFLARCRALVLMAPLTDETRDLFDARRLAMLPEGAWLINVARGALVVDEALVAALDSGRLAGASLDVFRDEPLPAEHAFWRHPRIRLTPHVSAVTLVRDSADQVAAKIRRLQRGETVTGIVDRASGY